MESRRHVFVVAICCLVALAACRKPTANPPTSTQPAAPVAVEAPVSGGESPAAKPVFRLSSVAVDCTSAVVFAPLTPDSDIFMRDACDDLSGVTIGVNGREETLDAIAPHQGRSGASLAYGNERYTVIIEPGPRWSAMRQAKGLCRELAEAAMITLRDEARSETFSARMEKRCPYDEGE